jgi:acyl carrier protein
MTPERIRRALVESLAELTHHSVSGISDGARLVEDLGVDSMIVVNLVMAIEDRLGVRLPEGSESSLVDAKTVADLTERLVGVFRAAASYGSSQ